VLLHKTLLQPICQHFAAEDGVACHADTKVGVEVIDGADEEDRKGSLSEVAIKVAGHGSTQQM